MLSTLTGMEDEIVNKMGPCLKGIYTLMEEIDKLAGNFLQVF